MQPKAKPALLAQSWSPKYRFQPVLSKPGTIAWVVSIYGAEFDQNRIAMYRMVCKEEIYQDMTEYFLIILNIQFQAPFWRW